MPDLEEHKIQDLYEGVRGLAVKVLNRVERTDSYLDKLLDSELKNSELSGQDKALLFEIAHGVVRWMGRLDWILNGFYKGQFSKAIPNLKNGLRVALYQIMFLDKIPDHAAVNEAVEFVKKLQGQKPADLTNAILRNIIRSKNAIRYPDPEEDLPGYIAAYYSHPSWMVKRYLARFGREETEKLLEANNERPQLTLKLNTLKTNPEEFRKLLSAVGLKNSPGRYLHEYIRLHNLSNITQWKYFTEGYFDVQDESAGFACRILGAEPGMRVLDLCAAPGGKTSYIAALMKNKGTIITLDKYESRINILQKNIQRLGFENVKILEEDALSYNDSEGFDRVLADVPCSGTGTLSKKPDIKWKKDLLDIRKSAQLQNEFIEKAASLVKPGGTLVYSTCSIEPEENFEIVNAFLQRHPEFSLKSAEGEVPLAVIEEHGCVQTFPHVHNVDGAFAAKLVKQN